MRTLVIVTIATITTLLVYGMIHSRSLLVDIKDSMIFDSTTERVVAKVGDGGGGDSIVTSSSNNNNNNNNSSQDGSNISLPTAFMGGNFNTTETESVKRGGGLPLLLTNNSMNHQSTTTKELSNEIKNNDSQILQQLRVVEQQRQSSSSSPATTTTTTTTFPKTIVRDEKKEEEDALGVDNTNTTTTNIIINNNTNTNYNNTRVVPDGTIVIHLSGELGNQLSHLARGYGMQLWAKEKYDLNMSVVLRHQPTGRKWIGARRQVVQCFPQFNDTDFSLGNSIEYDTRIQQQDNWKVVNNTLLDIDGPPFTSHFIINDPKGIKRFNARRMEINQALSHVQELVIRNNYPKPDDLVLSMMKKEEGGKNYDDDDGNNNNNNNSSDVKIMLPYINSTCMCPELLLDNYYNEIRELLKFDFTSCCEGVPDPDESVLHFRNFQGEMPKNFRRLGFEELSGKKIANEVFSHLKSGDKVAIATRRHLQNMKPLEEVVQALEDRGLSVRVTNHTEWGHDFCFLTKAQKELVGYAGSTFAQWAAYLGNTPSVRLYHVDSPVRRYKISQNQSSMAMSIPWTNPLLSSRIKYEVYTSDQADEQDAAAAASLQT